MQSEKPIQLPVVQTHATTYLDTYFPDEKDWAFMLKWGESVLRSGMLPTTIKTREAAAIIVLKGRELGLSFMTSIAHIHIINGKPTMSAELIQFMARKNLPGLMINILESTNEIARIELQRPEKTAKPYVISFSWEDATKAGLTKKDSWKNYPAAMLWSRAVTAGLRKVCPETLMGVSYTPEEMGAEVDREGNVVKTIETTSTKVPERDVSQNTVIESISYKQSEEIKAEGGGSQDIPPTPRSLWPIGTIRSDVVVELKKIRALKTELKIDDAEFQRCLHAELNTQTLHGMSISDLRKVVELLEEEKRIREMVPLPSNEEPPAWLQESMGPPPGVAGK